LNNLSDHTKIAEGLFDFNISVFDAKALEIFRFQALHNPVYRQYIDLLGVKPDSVARIVDIPFLPVRFFKTHQVVSGDFEPQAVFESSGTTGSVNSRHYVKDTEIYRNSFLNGFKKFFGDPSGWCIIGLLPSYLERQHSSLVYMVDDLVKRSRAEESGFYLYEFAKLHHTLTQLEQRKQKTILIGVTFALLDFAEQFPMILEHTIVMETGGMKGRREEMTRQQVHDLLSSQLGVKQVYSEYGMTELLSQGYSKGEGLFRTSDTMKILLRDEDDPLHIHDAGDQPRRGIINVIDLANIFSCSFIATEDAGKLYSDGSFEVTGRVDNSDIRGCTLMVV
jgi:phenylacetate-coenzyme A ligase PaaK-like adenylate-forming protein